MNTRGNEKISQSERTAHHLWSANATEEGKISVMRSKAEPEEFDLDPVEKEAAEDISKAYWGIWGASLADNELLSTDIPKGIVDRLNIVAVQDMSAGKTAAVHSWDKLRRAFGGEKINDIRKNVSDGIRIRVISKYLNVPFVVTAELVDHLGDIKNSEFKSIMDLVKSGRGKKAAEEFGAKAKTANKIYNYYRKTGATKLAVDDKARMYFESYYGPFGKELTREVKKRVRADLLSHWMKKNGVDEKAVEYWSAYYSDGYGEQMVKDLAKKLSPVK
jgi:hypothetical protein